LKTPRKVSLINVHDYDRTRYSAYYEIRVLGDELEGYLWGARIYDRASSALVEEDTGTVATRDQADTLAQRWVLKHMKKYRRPKPAKVAGYAIPLPVDMLGEFARWLGRLFAPWLLALAYSTTVRNNRLHQVRDAIDSGAGAGLLRIYDGSRPATCGAATTLLAELTMSDPCAGAAASGVLTMSAITADASANATGTATWFRNVDSTGTCCIDGNVGTAGSDLNLNSTSINAGVQVSVSSYVITAGNP